MKSLNTDSKNQLTSSTRTGTFAVAGVVGPGVTPVEVTVSGTGLSSGNANVYADGSWARAGATLADGNNSYTATAEDTTWPTPRTAQDSVTLNLPATVSFQYDGNGNLTNDGRRVFEYDYENQLTNVYVASAWKSVFQYDAFGRRRVRKEYTWQSSAWVLTNEVRYVYDGMRVIQERESNTPQVSYTRGTDLSGSLEGAGGIGGLLARSHGYSSGNWSTHNFYHADGNGNVTYLVNSSQTLAASYRYDPYGNTISSSGGLASANVYRFSSKELHVNSGLYYYGYRWYSPNLQRWLNRDPVGEYFGINLYTFAANAPIDLIDYDGLSKGRGGGRGQGGGSRNGSRDFKERPGIPPEVPGDERHAHECPEDIHNQPGSIEWFVHIGGHIVTDCVVFLGETGKWCAKGMPIGTNPPPPTNVLV